MKIKENTQYRCDCGAEFGPFTRAGRSYILGAYQAIWKDASSGGFEALWTGDGRLINGGHQLVDEPAEDNLQTDDASRWAEAFMAQYKNRDAPLETSTMTGWFANAIEISWMVRSAKRADMKREDDQLRAAVEDEYASQTSRPSPEEAMAAVAGDEKTFEEDPDEVAAMLRKLFGRDVVVLKVS